jgi:tetraacyldisaccharide 4'-kinase
VKRSSAAEQWFLSVISGQRRGMPGALARSALSAAEPVYRGIVQGRNFLYERQLMPIARADRPVISVGNLTTGGTGKTPLVAWLVGELSHAGRHPAVLLRGYRKADGISDEEILLRSLIAPSPVMAGADRLAASQRLLQADPHIDVFVLDDGLQHRRLAREFNIVLIDATQPFGFEHVLPRGLLREPIGALRRAQAAVITRCDLADAVKLRDIERRIAAEHDGLPIVHCRFVHDRITDVSGADRPIDELRGARILAFCGIGNPNAFFRQLEQAGATLVHTQAFPDHHAFTADDLAELRTAADQSNAKLLLSTQKDWVKVAPILKKTGDRNFAFIRVGVRIDEGDRLLGLVLGCLNVSAKKGRTVEG